LFGIKLEWITEIARVSEDECFLSHDRIGASSLWLDKHKIEEIKGFVSMTNIFNYYAPFGFLCEIANALYFKKQIKGIFNNLTIALEKHFVKGNYFLVV